MGTRANNPVFKEPVLGSPATQLCRAIALFGSLLVCLQGCNGYWWTRGQTAGPDALFSRAQAQLETSRSKNIFNRRSLSDISVTIENSLIDAVSLARSGAGLPEPLTASLEPAVQGLMRLEGLLSPTARPAYAEISGQLRELIRAAKKGDGVSSETLALFSARTLFLLADELSIPPPTADERLPAQG